MGAGAHSPIDVKVPASYVPATDEGNIAKVALKESHDLPARVYVDLATGVVADGSAPEGVLKDLSDRLKGMFSGERPPADAPSHAGASTETPPQPNLNA